MVAERDLIANVPMFTINSGAAYGNLEVDTSLTMSSGMVDMSPEILTPTSDSNDESFGESLNENFPDELDEDLSSLSTISNNLITFHDCMWTGLCKSEDHEDPSPFSPLSGYVEPQLTTAPVLAISPQVQQQRSLLKPQMADLNLNAVVHGKNPCLATPPTPDVTLSDIVAAMGHTRGDPCLATPPTSDIALNAMVHGVNPYLASPPTFDITLNPMLYERNPCLATPPTRDLTLNAMMHGRNPYPYLTPPPTSDAALSSMVLHGKNPCLATPPMSDDEESKPTDLTRDLSEVLENFIIADDKDLIEYLKEGQSDSEFNLFNEGLDEELELREQAEIKMSADSWLQHTKMTVEVDHSYSQSITSNLGLDTPSDSGSRFSDEYRSFVNDAYSYSDEHEYYGSIGSNEDECDNEWDDDDESQSTQEEEIDVVSVGDKGKTANLPTNPSTEDRQLFQRTMQSRFTTRGIKRRLPTKTARQPSPPVVVQAPVPKRKPAEPKGRRNAKQTKGGNRRRKYSCGDLEPSEKRSMHNDMERQRRIDLRTDFDNLKKVVPEVNKKQRAAKVQILRAAAQYCYHLQQIERANDRRLQVELKRQRELRLTLKNDFGIEVEEVVPRNLR